MIKLAMLSTLIAKTSEFMLLGSPLHFKTLP